MHEPDRFVSASAQRLCSFVLRLSSNHLSKCPSLSDPCRKAHMVALPQPSTSVRCDSRYNGAREDG